MRWSCWAQEIKKATDRWPLAFLAGSMLRRVDLFPPLLIAEESMRAEWRGDEEGGLLGRWTMGFSGVGFFSYPRIVALISFD
jgi:hypothetical protein